MDSRWSVSARQQERKRKSSVICNVPHSLLLSSTYQLSFKKYFIFLFHSSHRSNSNIFSFQVFRPFSLRPFLFELLFSFTSVQCSVLTLVFEPKAILTRICLLMIVCYVHRTTASTSMSM